MIVKECMTTDVELAKPDMTLKEVACLMRDGDFGFVPVEENDRMVGTITDRDICVRGVAAGLNPETALAREVMSQKVLYCFEDQTIEEVIKNLGDNQIRRLPVINRDKRLVGVLSLGDISVSEVAPKEFETAFSRISQSSSTNHAGRNWPH